MFDLSDLVNTTPSRKLWKQRSKGSVGIYLRTEMAPEPNSDSLKLSIGKRAEQRLCLGIQVEQQALLVRRSFSAARGSGGDGWCLYK